MLAVLLLLVVYAVLLAMLVICEKDQPGTHIHTFADAIWYSLVTISTVGYGDVTPVSPAGHVIGIIFLLMSMGVLVALFGSVVSVISSEGLPMLRLGLRRRSNWYYFADFTSEADVLAMDISKISAIIEAFCSEMEKKGYFTQIYCSSFYLNHKINQDVKTRYDVWVANYNVSVPSYTGAYGMWQYGVSTCAGISGDVDMSIWFVDQLSL